MTLTIIQSSDNWQIKRFINHWIIQSEIDQTRKYDRQQSASESERNTAQQINQKYQNFLSHISSRIIIPKLIGVPF
jgi:hypothetical protein